MEIQKFTNKYYEQLKIDHLAFLNKNSIVSFDEILSYLKQHTNPQKSSTLIQNEIKEIFNYKWPGKYSGDFCDKNKTIELKMTWQNKTTYLRLAQIRQEDSIDEYMLLKVFDDNSFNVYMVPSKIICNICADNPTAYSHRDKKELSIDISEKNMIKYNLNEYIDAKIEQKISKHNFKKLINKLLIK